MTPLIPMPSPHGTNYAKLYTKVSMDEDMAYDALRGRFDHFAVGYDTPPKREGRVMPDAEVARHAGRVVNRTLRNLGYKTAVNVMACDADEPDDNEDDDDYEARQIQKICEFIRDNLSSKGMGTLAKHLDAHRELKKQEETTGISGDDPPPFKGHPETGGTMTGDAAYDGFLSRFPQAHRIGADDNYGRQPRPTRARSGSEENFFQRFPEARRLG